MVLVAAALAATVVAVGAAQSSDGRWKIGDGGTCYFDDTDSGPDQCSPDPAAGRWKDDGNGGCYFDSQDSGPNQCTPVVPTEPSETDAPNLAPQEGAQRRV